MEQTLHKREGEKRGQKEGKRRKKKEKDTTTVASGKYNLKEFILSKIKPLGFDYNPLKLPKPYSSDVKS